MMRKYIPNPNKSFVVVMKGPDAKAGLNPNRLRIRGVIVPMKDAITTTLNKAKDTTSESF